MSSDALLTEALKMIQDNGVEDSEDDDDTEEEEDEDTDEEDEDSEEAEKERRKEEERKRRKKEKKHKHKRKKHKKEKKKKRERDRERERDDSEDEEERHHHDRKRRKRDRERGEDEEHGRRREGVWYPGDDRRDFSVKRVIRRYPTPPWGFGEEEDRHGRQARDRGREREERDLPMAYRVRQEEEDISRRVRRIDSGEDHRSSRRDGYRDNGESHRDSRRDHGDGYRSSEENHRHSRRDHRDGHRDRREDERRDHRGRDEAREESRSRRRDEFGRDQDRRREEEEEERRRRKKRDEDRSPDRKRSKKSSESSRPPVRKPDGDEFWDTRWEAMELQKNVDKLERKGQHYLDGEKVKRAFRTPTPEREKKRREKEDGKRSPSPDCDELKRLKELKDIQELNVKEDDMFVKEPADPSQFEYDEKTKMWRRKAPAGGERKAITYEEGERSRSPSPPETKAKTELTPEELEKKRRKEKAKEFLLKQEVKAEEEKEYGEWQSEDEREDEKRRRKQKRSRSRSRRSRSRSRDRRKGGGGGGGGGGSGNANKVPLGTGRGGRALGGGRRSRSRSPEPTTRRSSGRGGFGYRSRSRSRSPYRYGGRGGFGYRRSSRSRSRSPEWRGGFGGRSRSRSRDRYRSRGRSPYRRRGPRYRTSRSRSREDGGFRGSRSAIDKEKLLAIAKKNAVKLLSSDNLMGMDERKLKAIKSGGQSLEQLTDFCRELARKGITDEFSDEEILQGGSDDEDRYHHPFAVTDKPLPNPYAYPGSSIAPSGIALEYQNPAMKAAAKSHRMIEFPVSSGNAHREKEKVERLAIEEGAKLALEGPSEEELKKKEEEMAAEIMNKSVADAAAALLQAAREESEFKEEKTEKEEEKESVELVPTAAQIANKQNPLGVLMFGGEKEPEEVQKQLVDAGVFEAPTSVTNNETNTTTVPTTAAKEESAESASKAPEAIAAPPEPSSSEASTSAKPPAPVVSDKVFPDKPESTMDISSIVSQRLAAMRKLEDNPNDPEALQKMYVAQKAMSTWLESKNKPGQFTGHTGAKVMSKAELNLGVQAWARQDQFTTAKKVSGGFGEYLLRKMGWTEGDGLGKDRTGDVDPLTLDIKFDKRGLMATEEILAKTKGNRTALTLTGCKDLQGKHPVSALIEVSTKRRWGQPNFVQAFEVGPPHRKQYIFKVTHWQLLTHA